jgi:hypothetical protein
MRLVGLPVLSSACAIADVEKTEDVLIAIDVRDLAEIAKGISVAHVIPSRSPPVSRMNVSR